MEGKVKSAIIFLKCKWWIFILAAGILIIFGGGYFGYVKFVDYTRTQAEKEKNAQILAEAQNKVLEDAKAEIEKSKQNLDALKKDVEDQKAATALEEEYNDLKDGYRSKYGDSNAITAYELNSYISGVVKIHCKNAEGSGSLWKVNNKYFVLTNAHVVESVYPDGSCTFIADDTNEKFEGIYYIYPNKKILSSEIDVALVPIGDSIPVEGLTTKLKENLNYNISSLRRCSKKMPQGSKIVIIGYPAYAKTKYTIEGIRGVSNARIITEGVISGYSSILPTDHPNYYVSAKTDSGNSGGIALSKDEKGLCFLGIPTWLSLGNYETQGVVQNSWYLLINLMAL